MKRLALLVLPVVAFATMATLATASSAAQAPAAPSTPAVVQSTTPPPSNPAGEFAGKRCHGPSLKAIMEKLGITDEQKIKIRALYVDFRDRTRKTRMELRSLKDEKKTMLLSGKIDQQKLAQIDDQVVKLVSDLLKEKLKLRRDRLAQLTPEQIGRIADWQAEKGFRSKMMKRMHMGQMHDGD